MEIFQKLIFQENILIKLQSNPIKGEKENILYGQSSL